jgi:hypothetical protein
LLVPASVPLLQDLGSVEPRLKTDLRDARYLSPAICRRVDSDDVGAALEREGIDKLVASVNEISRRHRHQAPFPPRGRVGTTASVGRLAAPLHRGGCVFQKVLERLSPHASQLLGLIVNSTVET